MLGRGLPAPCHQPCIVQGWTPAGRGPGASSAGSSPVGQRVGPRASLSPSEGACPLGCAPKEVARMLRKGNTWRQSDGKG